MAGSTLGIRVDIADREIRDALKRLEDAGGDLKPAFQDIGEYLDLTTRQRFDREQAPDGTPWEPLAESTLRRKMLGGVRRGKGEKRRRLTKRRGGTKVGAIRALTGSRVLVDSGSLRDTLRYRADRGGVEFGTDRVYGAIHQFGGEDVGKPEIPARPYLGLSADDKAEVLEILQGHLRRVLEG